MSLLMGDFHQRDPQRIGQHFCMGVAHHETGHIAALHSPGPGGNADSRNPALLHKGKQPAGKLRQAFDMGKYSVGLTQSQLALLYRQQPGAILTAHTIKTGMDVV